MNASGVYFSVCSVYGNRGVEFVYECSADWYGRTYGFAYTTGLRPCISLKSDSIKITGGDGTSADTAYTIGK